MLSSLTNIRSDQQAKQNGGDLGIFQPEQMVEEFSQAVIDNNVGDYFEVKTRFGIHIAQVTSKSTPVKKVLLAVITQKVEPSEATQQTVYGKVSQFIAAANGSAENFEKAVTDNALSKRVARIYNTERNINGMENSREVVRWAFNAEKKGEVSPVTEVSGNYVVALLTGINEDGIAPIELYLSRLHRCCVNRSKLRCCLIRFREVVHWRLWHRSAVLR